MDNPLAAELDHVLEHAGPAWDELWSELRYYRVREDHGREALRPAALHHLHAALHVPGTHVRRALAIETARDVCVIRLGDAEDAHSK